MAEIVVRVGGRNVSVEVSDGEARKILSDLLFQSIQSVDQTSKRTESATETMVGSRNDIGEQLKPIVSGSDFLPVPSREEVEAFIKSQPEYRHSVESIAEHFAHRDVSGAEGEAAMLWLNSIRGYGNRIRASIANQEQGEWKSDRHGRRKTFRFVKQDYQQDSLLKQSGEESQNQGSQVSE